ncbi:LysR family transcriptional regulator [Vibrio aphrogenes]|uniref:LysR family transcriptional regulator n=1 Tax=Vibrio aphrogenes TaxID=1891186 RepID=UPI000B35EF2B|nr:LysR family transcriptional regulator [Vibrio aphrogenes]
MKNTELNLIPIFVAIYEEQSLSKAAKRLSISQPAVSKALKRLREVYEDPLFNRSISGVEPTTFAMDIYPAFEAALANFNSTLSSSRNFDPKTSNKTFSIACLSVLGFNWLSDLIELIQQTAPFISLEVHPLFTQDYETDLRLQRYDLIIGIAPHSRSMLKHELLVKEQGCVVYSDTHPRLNHQHLDKEAFFNEEHIAISRWQVRRSLLNNDHIHNIDERRIIHRVPGAPEMLSVIEKTECIGLLPQSTVDYFKSLYKVKIAPLPFDNVDFGFCIIWHPSRTNDTAHQWLRKQLKIAVERRKTE